MPRKTVLGLAVRIIVVGLIILSLRDLVSIGGAFLSFWGQEENSQIGQFIPMFLSPVVMLIIAALLMKNIDRIAERAYPAETEDDIDEVGVFNLAMKITGLIFMVWAIPDLVQIISKLCYISYLAPSIYHQEQTMYVADHLPNSLLFLLLGWYLLKSGRLFTKMAFKMKNE
ncbi:MAG: hypothetical protein H6Q64_533 [Firmicutes bacterium]|nr:hypothetical protein [Bacillota bacterium]